MIKQANALTEKKEDMVCLIKLAVTVAVMAVVASRHAIQDQLLCLALQCGLDFVRAMQDPAIMDGHKPRQS